MSATTQQPRKPVAGPTFRRVAAMNIAGGKRRKVLALIAAYVDGGCRPPTTRRLADRLGLSRQKVTALLGRLERDGLVVPTRCAEDAEARCATASHCPTIRPRLHPSTQRPQHQHGTATPGSGRRTRRRHAPRHNSA
jgi:hypothetical protein